MKFISTTILLLLFSVFIAPVQAINSADLPLYSKIYNEQRNPFDDATAALVLAKKTNRQVLIEIGGNWCSWCHKMDVFLENNPEVYQALHAKYVLLKVSVSDSNENAEFMASLPPVLGYPHMYISTSNGKMILSKDTAELVSGDNYSVKQWLTFLNKWSVAAYDASAKTLSPTEQKAEQ